MSIDIAILVRVNTSGNDNFCTTIFAEKKKHDTTYHWGLYQTNCSHLENKIHWPGQRLSTIFLSCFSFDSLYWYDISHEVPKNN